MNKNIKNYSSKGGVNRANKLSPQVRSEIARKASKARWKNHKQASECLVIPEENYRKKYFILAEFIRSKGADPEDIIEMAEEVDY